MTPHNSFIVLAATAVLIAGCGTSENTGQAAGSSVPSVTTVAPADMTDQQQPTPRLRIGVTIKDGQVTPTGETVQGKVKDPIVIHVNSDAEDELVVHSTPDHTFKIEPRVNQQFQFTVDSAEDVRVALRHLDRTVATIQVQE